MWKLVPVVPILVLRVLKGADEACKVAETQVG